MKNYRGAGNGGHAKGHVREAFDIALEVFHRWNFRGKEPTIEFEDREITLSQAAGLVWNCSDTLPSSYASLLDEPCRSYAAAARHLKREISTRRNVAQT